MKNQPIILCICYLASIANAFTSRRSQMCSPRTDLFASLPSPEESAKALSDYMAKSHEEKLKAIKTVEDKKNAEIKALQTDIDKLKSQSSQPTTALATTQGSKEDMAAKLLAYQQFMAQYVVRASEEKLKAVKLAEAAIAKKYEEKLNAFLLNAAPSQSTSVPAITVPNVPTGNLYTDRNAKVVQAAQAGKSRWGDLEIRRAESLTPTSRASPVTATPSMIAIENSISPQVLAADKGLRKEGAVGGITLAERVAFGSKAASTEVRPSTSAASSATVLNTAEYALYNKRNAMISSAFKAGKQSRWGPKEEERALTMTGFSLAGGTGSPSDSRVNVGSTMVSNPTSSSSASKKQYLPEVIELADKGLRKEGAVGGFSLAERVSLGSKVNSLPTVSQVIDSAESILYLKRNAMILAASKAGKQSRWGPREEERAVRLAGLAPPSESTVSVVSKLQTSRVNLGAKLLATV